MKTRIKKLSALVIVAALAAAVSVGAYLTLTPQATQATGGGQPGGHWGIPDIRYRFHKPPEISANDVKTQSGKFAWHAGNWQAASHCPTKVGFLGTYRTIAEAEIRVDGPPGKRLLQVPIRIGDNRSCGQHTVYFSTVDNETQERAEHGKDYEPVTNGRVVFEQGQNVGLAEVWIKGDKVIEDKESFDLVITGMTWDDTGYKDVNITPERTKPPYQIVTTEQAKKNARRSAGSPSRKISVYPDLQIARVTINSLHGSGDGWTEQGEKRPLPSEVFIFGSGDRAQTRIYEGQSAKFYITGIFQRWPNDAACQENVTVDWTTKETPHEASAYYKLDFLQNLEKVKRQGKLA